MSERSLGWHPTWGDIQSAIRLRLMEEGFDGIEAHRRAANAIRSARVTKVDLPRVGRDHLPQPHQTDDKPSLWRLFKMGLGL